MAKISNVGVHNLSPGMVTTELLMSGANTPTAKFFINCLGWCLSCFTTVWEKTWA
jgi:chlorophyll(ide) b reductase